MQSTLDHAVQGDLAQKLKARLDNRTAKIGIMGLGYVGLPLALLFSEQKFPVTGFDIDKKKVDTLNTGRFLHLPHHQRRDRRSAQQWFHRYRRSEQDLRDGRHHHLRAYAAE